MAKQSGDKNGSSRFRLVVIEADGFDGADIAQVAQAVQSALRPQQIIQQRIIASPTASLPAPNATAEDIEEILEDGQNGNAEQEVKPRKTRETRTRKVYSPEVVPDLDMKSDPAWSTFAESKGPKSNVDRYLVAAEWCRSARGIAEVTADHIFTCFKIAEWPTNNPDFSGPLRHLKAQKFMGPGAWGRAGGLQNQSRWKRPS